MTTITSSADTIRRSGQFEPVIQQLIDLERMKKNSFKNERSTLERQKNSVNAIASDLSALRNSFRKFKNQPGETLSASRIESANTSAIQARLLSQGSLNERSVEIEVLQLARADLISSDVFDDSASTLQFAGLSSIDIQMGSGNDPITISVDTNGLTDRQALEAISQEIKQTLGSQVQVDLFQVRPGESVLSIQQTQTGSEHAITLSNRSGAFSNISFNQPLAPEDLDAQLKVNGIYFERGSNSIDDIVQGIGLELQSVSGPTKIQVTRDSEAGISSIEKLIDSFNSLNEKIRRDIRIDPQSGNNGLLARERQLRALSQNLREIAIMPVASLSGTAIQNLTDLGITAEVNGSLRITDRAALETRINENLELVEQLFNNSDGLVARIEFIADQYAHRQTGMLQSIENGFNARIERLNTRIQREEAFLVRREEQLRKEYGQLEQMLSVGQNQFNQVMNFGNRINNMFK